MPIFEFKCKNCNHKFEELVFSALTDSSNITCPECGIKNAEKLMSACSSSGMSDSGFSGAPPCGRSGFS
jgi:putative FmdB family regulatory protein